MGSYEGPLCMGIRIEFGKAFTFPSICCASNQSSSETGEVRNKRSKGPPFSFGIEDRVLIPELCRESLLLHDLLCATLFIMQFAEVMEKGEG